MEGSDAPLVGLVDPPRYSPRLRGDTSGRDPLIVLWGRVGGASRGGTFSPDGRGPFARREIGTFDEFSSRQLVLSSTNQKRSNPRADAESKVCVLLTFLSGGSVRRRQSSRTPTHLHQASASAHLHETFVS